MAVPVITCATELDASGWDEFVHACPEASAYHQWKWRYVFERAFGHETAYLIARCDDRIARRNFFSPGEVAESVGRAGKARQLQLGAELAGRGGSRLRRFDGHWRVRAGAPPAPECGRRSA